MLDDIDWKAIAVRLGTLRKGGESSGSDKAREAIELLLGEDNLRKSVSVRHSSARTLPARKHIGRRKRTPERCDT